MSDKQAIVYLTLLEYDSLPASALARLTGIKRATVYSLLQSMMVMGAVSEVVQQGVRYFHAVEPTVLLQQKEMQYKKLEESLPAMQSLS
jgi:sugar-specific transcriptional regulator TrmB